MHSKLAREDIFITTKVWNTDQGYDQTLKAFEKSLELIRIRLCRFIFNPLASKRNFR